MMLFFHLLDDQLCLDAHIQGITFFRTEPWKHMETTDAASGYHWQTLASGEQYGLTKESFSARCAHV